MSDPLTLFRARARARRSFQLNLFLSRECRRCGVHSLRISRRPLPVAGIMQPCDDGAAVIYRTTDRIVAWPSRASAGSITRVGKATRKNSVGGKGNGRGWVFHYPVCLIPGRFWCVGHRFSAESSLSLSLALSLPPDRPWSEGI